MSLVKCSECGKEVSSRADNCPNCGNPIKSGGMGCIGWGITIVVIFIAIGYFSDPGIDSNQVDINDPSENSFDTYSGGAGDEEPPEVNSGPKLELVGDWTWGRTSTGTFVEAKGRVKNISDQRIEHVQALVEWTDESGNLVTSEATLIEYDPIMPGQTSPWTVTVKNNPAMHEASLRFKKLMGGSIEVKY